MNLVRGCAKLPKVWAYIPAPAFVRQERLWPPFKCSRGVMKALPCFQGNGCVDYRISLKEGALRSRKHRNHDSGHKASWILQSSFTNNKATVLLSLCLTSMLISQCVQNVKGREKSAVWLICRPNTSSGGFSHLHGFNFTVFKLTNCAYFLLPYITENNKLLSPSQSIIKQYAKQYQIVKHKNMI